MLESVIIAFRSIGIDSQKFVAVFDDLFKNVRLLRCDHGVAQSETLHSCVRFWIRNNAIRRFHHLGPVLSFRIGADQHCVGLTHEFRVLVVGYKFLSEFSLLWGILLVVDRLIGIVFGWGFCLWTGGWAAGAWLNAGTPSATISKRDNPR